MSDPFQSTLGRCTVMTAALFMTSLLALATYCSHPFESLLLRLPATK